MKSFLKKISGFIEFVQERLPILGATVVFILLLDMIMRVGFMTPLFLSFLFVLIVLELYFFGIVKEMMRSRKQYPFVRFVAHLSIFTFLTIFLFGALFAYFGDSQNYLFSTVSKEVMGGFDDAVYFSGVTLLSIGYGDIVPYGFFRIMSLIEGFIGSFIILSFFSLGVSQIFMNIKSQMLKEQQLLKRAEELMKKEEKLLEKEELEIQEIKRDIEKPKKTVKKKTATKKAATKKTTTKKK